MAHFMGADGAGDFLEAMNANPDTKGANLFKAAACANPNIFFDRSGNARSLSQIYALFDKKFDLDGSAGTTQYAAATTPSTPGDKADYFDEAKGRWITYKPRTETAGQQLATVATTAARALAGNMGGIPGYRTLMANPVDIMSLLQYGQSDTDKKTNIWG